jgi:hypothetical protein
MRLGPIFLSLAITAWLYLAALAWAFAGVLMRREPRFTSLALGVLAGAAGVGLALLVGRRGGAALVLSFPFSFSASFLVCAGYYVWRCSSITADSRR